MTNDNSDSTAGYAVRTVPFDEWTDIDTLVHRTAITSGDFDYVLSTLCPDCGVPQGLSYDDTGNGESVLARLICDACSVVWQPASGDRVRDSG